MRIHSLLAAALTNLRPLACHSTRPDAASRAGPSPSPLSRRRRPARSSGALTCPSPRSLLATRSARARARRRPRLQSAVLSFRHPRSPSTLKATTLHILNSHIPYQPRHFHRTRPQVRCSPTDPRLSNQHQSCKFFFLAMRPLWRSHGPAFVSRRSMNLSISEDDAPTMCIESLGYEDPRPARRCVYGRSILHVTAHSAFPGEQRVPLELDLDSCRSSPRTCREHENPRSGI